jgi:hypothetical protein
MSSQHKSSLSKYWYIVLKPLSMNQYTNFWKGKLKEVLKDIQPSTSRSFDLDVKQLSTLGNRPSSGFSGRLMTIAGEIEKRTDSAIFRSLQEVVTDNVQFKNLVPGHLKLWVYNDTVLKVEYTALSFEFLIQRYRSLPEETKQGEVYKWKIIKSFQDAWEKYSKGTISFQNFFLGVDFRNLIFHNGITVFKHLAREKPKELESLLLKLYDD